MAAVKAAGKTTVTYNSHDISAYCNQNQLNNTVAELEATNLASTAMESDPGLPGHDLDIGGDWNATLDGYLAPDAMTSTKRTAVITFVDATPTTVTYTWTSQAFITNYQVKAAATGKLEWTAKLRLSGAGSRA